MKLLAARAAMKNVKLRTRFARLAQDLRDGNSHTPEVIEAKMAENVNEAIVREIAKQEKAIMESEEQSSKRLAQTTCPVCYQQAPTPGGGASLWVVNWKIDIRQKGELIDCYKERS